MQNGFRTFWKNNEVFRKKTAELNLTFREDLHIRLSFSLTTKKEVDMDRHIELLREIYSTHSPLIDTYHSTSLDVTLMSKRKSYLPSKQSTIKSFIFRF